LQWKPVIYLPANLTVRFDVGVLTADDPAPWCQERAAELLGPDANRKKVRQLAECLDVCARSFRADPLPTCGALFFYPDFARLPPRAVADIYVFGPDPVLGPMTLTRARDLYVPDEYSFGETEMTETEVPAGPALRVHRFRKGDRGKRREVVMEELSWIICPPDSTQAAAISTKWGEPMFSEAGLSISDNMAKNFRAEPIHHNEAEAGAEAEL
jgi:hypothetical protein